MKKKIPAKAQKSVEVKISGVTPLPAIESLPSNPNIPTHHADIVNMMMSSDGLALLSFFSRTPGANIEECRISFSHEMAKKIANMVCIQLDYSPQKPSQKGKKKK